MSTYDIEDLQRTLSAGADQAPDPLGVLEGAHRRATGLRRRLRTFQAVGVTAAVAAVAVATPAVLDALGGQTNSTGRPASSPASDPMGMQLTLRPNGHAESMLVAAGTTLQHMEIRGKAREEDGKFSGTARLHSPGTFDASKVRGGEPVTVNGKPAYYLADGGEVYPQEPNPDSLLPIATSTGPRMAASLVAWEEAPGEWVTVSSFSQMASADMVVLADLVEVTTPALPPSPFYLGYLPAGLVPQGTLTHAGARVSLAFGTASQPLAGTWGAQGFPDYNEPLLVDANPLTPETVGQYRARLAQVGAPTKLGAYDSWYVVNPDIDGKEPNSATLTVMTAACHVQFSVEDRNRIPRAEVERIALAADFKDCTTPSTWVRPVP